MRVIILGAGALGSLYGAWFAKGGAQVQLLCRPNHAKTIVNNGLTIRDIDGSETNIYIHATSNPSDLDDADIVVVAAKSFDIADILSSYKRTAGAVFSLQNGPAQTEPLVERFGPAAIGCVSMVGATFDSPGIVSHTFTG